MPRQKIERLADLGALGDRKHVREEPEGVLRSIWRPIEAARYAVDQIPQMTLGRVADYLAGNNLPVDNVTRPARGRIIGRLP